MTEHMLSTHEVLESTRLEKKLLIAKFRFNYS